MKRTLKYIIAISILTLMISQAYSQKMSSRTQRRAKAAATQILLDFKNNLNNIYKENDDGTPQFNPEYVKRSAFYFYKSDSTKGGQIHRSFIDTKDTLLRDLNEMINIETFLDTLVAWYCDIDSCETGIIFDFTDIQLDTTDYYMDPEILAINLYFDVDFYGDLYAPHMEKYMKKETEVVEEESDDDAIFYVEDYSNDWQTLQADAAMATFLITLDGEDFKSVKLYKLYSFDPFEADMPDLREIIRPVIASRNKMYLNFQAGIGYSKAIAKFDNEEKFESLNDFRLGYNAELSFEYFFNDGPKKTTYGFSAGVGYSVYNSSVSVERFDQSFSDYSNSLQKDFIRNVYAKNLEQDLTLNYLDVPLSFKMKYKPRNYINFYGELGVAVSYLFSTKIEPAGSGEINYTGTFTYNFPEGQQTVTYADIPYYGFTNYTNLAYSDASIEFEEINISPMINAGVMFYVTPRVAVNLELMYRYGLINLVKTSQDNFIISEGEGKVNNVFMNCSSLSTNAFMLNTGLSYFLKSNK